MLGLAAGVAFEAEGFAAVQIGEHLLVASEMGTVFAPTEHHAVDLGAPMGDPAIIVGTDWVSRALHVGRQGRSPREEIEHDKKRVSPGGGEIADTAQGWIELVFVGGARVEADPGNAVIRGEQLVPAVDQCVTVAAVGGKDTLVGHDVAVE